MAPFEHPVQIRFSDLDGLGHVNNAVFLSYLEDARVAFFEQRSTQRGLDVIGFLLARVEIDYRRPVYLEDDVHVELWVESIGTTSFTLGYQIRASGDVAVEATTVLVFFDEEEGETVPVPDDARAFLEESMP